MPLSPESVRVEVLAWVDAQLREKKFGSFGVEVKMHEGVPVNVEKRDSVSIKYQPES
ncbi:MAG TPA: hypothetical protein PLB79_05165 [Thermotogota bacterium]|nr:hypothetical protein [Thermotogota bacterium]